MNVQYVIDGDKTTLLSFPRESQVILPSVVDGYTITHIGKGLFQHCKVLRIVKLPDVLQCIRSYAFRGCVNLEKVDIPDSVLEIGRAAFWGCSSLSQVSLPENLLEIRAETFWNCSKLSSIIIPCGVKKIGLRAFEGCESLETVIIPKSVDEICGGAFSRCKNLKSVEIPLFFKKEMETPISEKMEIAWKNEDPMIVEIEKELFAELLGPSENKPRLLCRHRYFDDYTELHYY